MLKPEQMSRLLIVATRDQMGPVISELYRHNLFHIEDYVEAKAEGYEGFKIGTPLAGASEISGDLVKIRAIQNAIAVREDDLESVKKSTRTELKSRIESELPALEHDVEELTVKRSRLEARVKEFDQKIAEIKPFVNIPVDLDLYRGYTGFSVFAGFVAGEVKLSVPSEVFFLKGKEKNFVVIIAPTGQRDEVERVLQESAFQAVQIPEESGMPQARIDYYAGQISTLSREITEINQSLADVKVKHAGFLIACEEFLRAEVDQTEAPLRFATTRETFVAEGWVPANRVQTVSDALVRVTGGKVFVTVVPTDPEHDTVPVEYHNPSFAKPAQMLMDVYSRPKYTELDPTLVLSIVFPIFFGLILGDVGYGLMLLALCFGLRAFLKGEETMQLLAVLRNASISSIIFGLLYSEFLAFELPWKPIMFSRGLKIGGGEAGGHGPAIPELMIMAIWIGILHITLGRIFGMINHSRQDHGAHRVKAVMANFGWLAVMWGILIVIWTIAAMPLMPDLTTFPKAFMGINGAAIVGGVMLVAGVLLIARDSALEIVELPTIISHVLSYARIVAVGLSSVAIAMVVNFIAIGMLITPQLENITIVGVLFIIMGVVVFLIGHVLNMALGILGGGLHSIRLHYVEFFTKFYKGGGKKYNPFGMKRRFTED